MLGLSAEAWGACRLSLLVALCAVAINLPPSVWLGYGLARRMRGKWLVETLVNQPLVMPPVVTGYLLLVLLGRHGPLGAMLERAGLRVAFTWLGCVAASAVVSFPLMTRAIRLAFQTVDPRLEAASRSLGAGRAETFFRVSMPLAAHGIVAGAILAFARSLGEFGATIMLAGNIPGQTQTLPLAIYSMTNEPGGMENSWPLVALAIVISCAALAAGEWIDRKQHQGGLS